MKCPGKIRRLSGAFLCMKKTKFSIEFKAYTVVIPPEVNCKSYSFL